MITLFITLFITLCLFTSVKSSGLQELQVQKLKYGVTASINCNLSNQIKDVIWLKQDVGKVPQWVVRQGKPSFRIGPGFSKARFSVDERFNLNIKEIKEEDTGTYLCVQVMESSLYIGSGTLLVVEAEEVKQHPLTEMVMENGESLALQCSVQAFPSSCEEQSVFWFRQRSGESHPGIIYTHRAGVEDCKKSSEAGSPTQSCVYTFSNLITSDNGTFYCAVAACGKILFGNGIKVEGISIKDNNRWLVFVLTTFNIIFVLVIIVLVGVLLKTQIKGASTDLPTDANQADDEDVLNYTAVRFAKKPSSSRTSRDRSHQDIYAQVKIK